MMRYDVRQTTDGMVRIWDYGLHHWCGLPDETDHVRVLTWPDTARAKAWLDLCAQRGLRIDLFADIPNPDLDMYQLKGLACARCARQLVNDAVSIGMAPPSASPGLTELFSCQVCATHPEREFYRECRRTHRTGWCHGCNNWTSNGVVKVLANNSSSHVQIWHGWCLPDPDEAEQTA